MTLKQAKTDIRRFLRDAYSDSDLVAALAHAIDKKLSLYSCCCFVGIPTADHALRTSGESFGEHYIHSKMYSPHVVDAEIAFRYLGGPRDDDALRQRRLIPMLRAEMRRRTRSSVTRCEAEQIRPLLTISQISP